MLRKVTRLFHASFNRNTRPFDCLKEISFIRREDNRAKSPQCEHRT